MIKRNLRDIFLYNDSQELNVELDVALENIMDVSLHDIMTALFLLRQRIRFY